LPNDTPIWISLSRRNYGSPMGTQTVGDLCKRYLGTSKVHTLRHTFAVAMEKAGAPISEIQNRLGHESAATTSIYLKQLHAADNPYAATLDDMFGVGD
jgi:integrase